MSQNDGGEAERTSFYRNRTHRDLGRSKMAEDDRRSSDDAEDEDEDEDDESQRRPEFPMSAPRVNPFLLNPLLAMGFQLPQLALFMQQQQQQSLPSASTPSLLNPLLIPHLMTAGKDGLDKSWPLSFPSGDFPLEEPQKGTIMTRALPHISAKGSPEKPDPGTTSGKQRFVCDLCHDWFFSREKLVIHLIMNHGMRNCSFCTELFESAPARDQHESDRHLPLECDMCKESLPSSGELAAHYEGSHDVRTCLYCGVLVRPKSYYDVHVARKHFVKLAEDRPDGAVKIVKDWQESSSMWTFECNLCGKERKKADTFGHFFSYHRFSLPCLVSLLASERIAFLVQGTPAPNSAPSPPKVSTPPPAAEDCPVCLAAFSPQVPKSAHDLFCRGLAPCRHCELCFPTRAARNMHVAREHGSHGCKAGCPPEVAFTQEILVDAHHLEVHDARACHYCDALVPAAGDTHFQEHLKQKHACATASVVLKDKPSDGSSDLFQLHSGAALKVVCSLCNLDITDIMRDIAALFKHLHYHQIPLGSALQLLENNSVFDTLNNPRLRGRRKRGEPEEAAQNHGRRKRGGAAPRKPKGRKENGTKPETEEDNADSSEASSDEEFCCGSASEEDEEDDDEEPGPAPTKTRVRLPSSKDELLSEANIDPSEVECVFTETTDDEAAEEEPPCTIKQESPGKGDSTPEQQAVIKQEPRDEPETTGIGEMTCEICSGKFSPTEGPWELVEHLRNCHGFMVHAPDHRDRDRPLPSSFHCPYCPTRVQSRPALRRHVSLAHGTECFQGGAPPLGPHLGYRCRCCSLKFWSPDDRNRHQLERHADIIDSFFKCCICLEPFTSKVVLNRHMVALHPDRPGYSALSYKCRLCLLMFPTLLATKRHFQDTHPACLVFHCPHCNLTLKTKKTLKAHIKLVCAQNLQSESRRRDCNLCGKVLWSKRAHAIHYRMKHSAASKVGFRCRICQRRFDSKDERKLHYQVDHEGESPYHCAECGKGFASKSGMYGHRQLHTGSGVSKCQYCGKEFTRKDSYNEHLLIHNGPRHKCPHCPKEFVQRSNLVRHIRIHTGEKPYKCLYCEKCFSDKGACNSHIRVHTREETCSCPYCGQTFSKKQKLKYHIRKHTGEGLINCEICSKSFTNSFALKEHRVIHNRQTQILCRQCGKGFNSEKYLQRHVAIVHEPSHSYSCPLCPKVFSQQARLKAHLMTHTGVKHIKCLLCDKAYSVRKSLRRHLLEKHQIAPDHPQYRQCFYAMSAEEAGLPIPVGVPLASRADDDSTSEEPPPPPLRRPGRKPGRKTNKKSAPFEDYTRVGKRKTKGKKGSDTPGPSTSAEPPRKMSPRRVRAPPIRLPDTDDSSDASFSGFARRPGKPRGGRVGRPPGSGRKKRRVEAIVETLQRSSGESAAPSDNEDDRPILARINALNSPPKRADKVRPGRKPAKPGPS